MPPLHKPLFRPDVVRQKLKALPPPDVPAELSEWADRLACAKMKLP